MASWVIIQIWIALLKAFLPGKLAGGANARDISIVQRRSIVGFSSVLRQRAQPTASRSICVQQCLEALCSCSRYCVTPGMHCALPYLTWLGPLSRT